MTQEEYAIFLMKGKKVTKVAADKPKLMTDRQWYRKARDETNETVER